jgi:putative tricarboxylic transport membrane protein
MTAQRAQRAQPNGPVQLIVHTPPGSGPDIMAQALVEGLVAAGADQGNWEIVHRAGGNGEEAMRTLVEQPGSSTLISTCTPSFLQTPLLKGLPFSFRNLTPLARLVSDRYLLVAKAGGPFPTAEAFGAGVSDRATRTGGYMAGGINHLVALAVEAQRNAAVEFVTLSSAADLVPALREERIDWGVGTPGEVLGGLEDGSLTALAVLAPEPLPRFPDVPPLTMAGVDVDITLWRGIMGPPDLTQEQQRYWDETLHAGIRTPAWKTYLERGVLADAFLGAAAFRELLEREDDWYREQLGRAGMLPASSTAS